MCASFTREAKEASFIRCQHMLVLFHAASTTAVITVLTPGESWPRALLFLEPKSLHIRYRTTILIGLHQFTCCEGGVDLYSGCEWHGQSQRRNYTFWAQIRLWDWVSLFVQRCLQAICSKNKQVNEINETQRKGKHPVSQSTAWFMSSKLYIFGTEIFIKDQNWSIVMQILFTRLPGHSWPNFSFCSSPQVTLV